MAVSCCFEWELLWHLLCWPDQLQSDSTSVSFSLCLASPAFNRAALGISHTSLCYSTALVPYVGRIAGGYPKPWDSLEAVEAFLKLSSFLTDKLFCMGMWGMYGGGEGAGWDAKETSSKTSCGCFYPLNLCKYTCTNTHCKLTPSLAVSCNTYKHK